MYVAVYFSGNVIREIFHIFPYILQKYQYPLTVVLYHLIIKLILAGLVRLLYRLFTGKSRVHIDWKTSLEKISPSGLASGLDIGFSNWGLALVTISL